MYRDIPHTADEAYEIVFSDESELFNDIVDIIKNEVDGEFKEEKREKVYELGEDLTDDIFDITNDMIYMVDRGWVPDKTKLRGKKLKVIYKKANIREFDFKALTYHMSLEDIGNSKILKVVFDT